MVFEYILMENGIDPAEVNIDQSIDFGSTAGGRLQAARGNIPWSLSPQPLRWSRREPGM